MGVFAVTCALVLVGGTGSALAAQLYTAPAGSGTACSGAQPCTLATALSHARSGDEVIVGPGRYGPSSVQLSSSMPNLNVHGVYGQPRPRIQSTRRPDGLALLGAGTQLRWVNIQDSGGNALRFRGQIAEQVVAVGTGGNPGCVLEATVLMRDSVCESDGGAAVLGSGLAITGNIALRNVTALGSGTGGVGVEADSGSAPGQSIVLSLFNTIARGPTSDISVVSGGQPAKVATSHSNWDPAHSSAQGGGTIIDDGTVQTREPLFDATGYHELSLSPTVDAGSFDPANGSSDIDGEPRSIGVGTDIGADERTIPPTVATGSVSFLSPRLATVLGSVTANGLETRYHYEYGRTSSYVRRTPVVDAGSGVSPQSVPATLPNLYPNTTFHFRLVASNAVGTTYGADQVLKTPSRPPAPPRIECIVPRLKGLTKRAATRRLRAAHCRRGRIYRRRTRRRRHIVVIAQSARPGRHLRAGTKVSFLLGPAKHRWHRSHHHTSPTRSR